METLGDALPQEMARVRELLPLYDSIPTGVFAATMMRQSLDRAARAMVEGDIAEVVRVFAELREFKE